MNNNNEQIISDEIGSIDERGFINSLNRQGFTPSKSGCELLANLIDAGATKGIFMVE